MTAEIECEVGVLGGGPAGSIMARQLAELGHDTLLVDRADRTKPRLAESLPPSVRSILESIRLQNALDAAVFCRERRALLLWGANEKPQIKVFDTAPSLLVDRTQLDDVLRNAAAHSGARIVAPATARSPEHHPRGGWVVPIVTSSGAAIMRARFLVDARGRRPHACVEDGAPPTVALSASFIVDDAEFTETRIEAGIDSWYWGIPLPRQGYAATVFLDSGRVAGLGAHDRFRLYRRSLSRSKLLHKLLTNRVSGTISVRDATARLARDLIGDDFIRIGEAAVTIDPLSSQGVQAAILSAIQGSAAVHTILSYGFRHDDAFEFYRERQHDLAVKSSWTAARFYRAHDVEKRFWKIRQAADGKRTEPTQRGLRKSALPTELSVSCALQIVEVPVLADGLVRRARALGHPQLERPTAYFDGIALAPLIADIRELRATEDILSRWARHVPLETATRIMDWMWSVGIVGPHQVESADRVSLTGR
jgi:flavin-dependent dehydrogenase